MSGGVGTGGTVGNGVAVGAACEDIPVHAASISNSGNRGKRRSNFIKTPSFLGSGSVDESSSFILFRFSNARN